MFLCIMCVQLWYAGSRVVLCPSHIFFFFKQKTAYEMRISDWSSDVCSSDLTTMLRMVPLPQGGGSSAHHPKAADQFAGRVSPILSTHSGKIGRALCRERVFQYV